MALGEVDGIQTVTEGRYRGKSLAWVVRNGTGGGTAWLIERMSAGEYDALVAEHGRQNPPMTIGECPDAGHTVRLNESGECITRHIPTTLASCNVCGDAIPHNADGCVLCQLAKLEG